MIYLDVTDSCQSPMNTGVQRVTRGIFRSLRDSTSVTPIVWDNSFKSFCNLSRPELELLEQPFAGSRHHKPQARPQRAPSAAPVWSKFWRQRTHARNRLDLVARLTAADELLLPEIFKDGRRTWMSRADFKGPARRIAVFHDAIAQRQPELASPASRKGFAEYMLAVSSVDAVISVSKASANDLRTFWKSEGVAAKDQPAITVLGWPADEIFHQVSPTRASAVSHPKILCVGSLEQRKNHLTLLAACEQLWRAGFDFELVLIGRTTAPFGERVLAEVGRLRKLKRPVEWRRHVDDATLLAAYDDCSFTVFPSLTEGFGLPIMESLMRGRPCICGVNGALGELAGKGCLIVEQTDAKKLADAIKQLLTDAELRERLSNEARSRQFATWNDYAAKLLPLLQANA